MEIKYDTMKFHPKRMYGSDAAWDLYALEDATIPAGGWKIVDTGLRIDIPHGYAGLVLSRSGLASRGVYVLNSPGLIDAGYIGSIRIILANMMEFNDYEVKESDRIAQLMIVRVEDITLAPGIFAGGARGEGGFGSTGN